MTNVWISAAGLCGASVLGSILGFGVRELSHKWNDTVLGFCAGMMLAASTIGLIVPAFEETTAWWTVLPAVMGGAFFLNVLDKVTPHLHHITGLDPEEHKGNESINHILLFVLAIAGMLVAPAVLLQIFFDIDGEKCFIYLMGLFILVKILLFYKCYVIFFKGIDSILQIILYFCALEIIPPFSMWGALLLISNCLKVNY